MKNKKTTFMFKIIFQILNICLITSCTLVDIEKDNDLLFHEAQKQLKKLIIPKDVFIPNMNQEYTIPSDDKDLQKNNHDIFPPI
jgi:uncharacterized lipoprotein